MNHFEYRDGVLHAEELALTELAAQVGTPFYCYSEATIRRHARVFVQAFQGRDTLVAYSVKANANIAVIRILASEGIGADVVSGGELRRARIAGVPADRIVFSGVGKTRVEMADALDEGIHQFNVESENELLALDEVARSKGRRAPVAFRLNPDVSAGGHEKISTGRAEDKFGIAWSRARALYAKASAMSGIDLRGVDVHIGSQITSLEPFDAAFRKVADLVRTLRADGCAIDRVDLGGGLGIPYREDAGPAPHPNDYAALIGDIFGPLDVQLILEPGRLIVGNAGVLVTRLLYVKQGEERRFLIVDAGMNDLIRPALYDAHHEIIPVRQPQRDAHRQPFDIVGPVCETGDRFAKARHMPPVGEGELLAVLSAGAYGAVLSSQYNSRPLTPEVLVNGDRFAIVRHRPTFEAMVANEAQPAWLAP